MRTSLSFCAAALAVSACSVGRGDNEAAGTDVAAAAANDMTPEGPGLATRLFGGGKPMQLDIQQQAANGMILYVTSLQAKPTETVVGIKVVNGADRDVELQWTDHKSFLAAQGQKFWLSPPVENKNLTVAKGATMQGELVFLGRLPKDGAVTMVFNDGMSNSDYQSTPGISVPIPIGRTAFSDDGSKKNSAV